MKRATIKQGTIRMGLTYRLNLTKQQQSIIESWIKKSRVLYNECIEAQRINYQIAKVTGGKKNLSAFDLQKGITDIRQNPNFYWLAELPYEICKTVTERVAKAYESYFENVKKWKQKGSKPNEKPKTPKNKKFHEFNSINFDKISHIGGNQFRVPKLGAVKIKTDWIPESATVKTCSIIKKYKKFFLSVSYEVPEKPPLPFTGKSVGIDAGIVNIFTDSDGIKFQRPLLVKEYEKKLKVLDRKSSRQLNVSKNNGLPSSERRKKTLEQRSALYEKSANIRTHFIHQVSNYYVRNYDFIAVEDLAIENMVKNKKLAKHIQNVSWAKFFATLEYKCKWYRKTFLRVPPQYTSQTCNNCGHVAAENRKTQAKFCCVSCGHIDNADVNAAKNILKLAQNIQKG